MSTSTSPNFKRLLAACLVGTGRRLLVDVHEHDLGVVCDTQARCLLAVRVVDQNARDVRTVAALGVLELVALVRERTVEHRFPRRRVELVAHRAREVWLRSG